MKLVLMIDGKEWIEVPVRNPRNIPWQAKQLKREYQQWIESSNEWKILLCAGSKIK